MIFYGNNDSFLHFITNDFTSTCFSQISFFHVDVLLSGMLTAY